MLPHSSQRDVFLGLVPYLKSGPFQTISDLSTKIRDSNLGLLLIIAA